jgi:acyl-coenzyme A synthetase/AMP-(fatty) acid ligase
MTAPAATVLADGLARHGSRPALRVGGDSYTYRELARRGADYQMFAREAGLQASDRVMYAAGPGLDFYGCLLAGILGSYTVCAVPPETPAAALAGLAGQVGARVIISDAPDAPVAPDALTYASTAVREATKRELTVAGAPHAYLSLTSGTTGAPTAALVDGVGLGAFLSWARQELELTVSDRWFEAADPTGDLAMTNALLAFSSGACLAVAAGRQRLRAATLAAANQTTVMRLVPAVGRLMLAEASRRPVALPALRLLAFGGDDLPSALPVRLLDAVRATARTVNTYGMTEAAGFLLYHWFDAREATGARESSVPIGQPVPGVTADIDGGGEEGELTVTGPPVALEVRALTGQRTVLRKPAAGAVGTLRTGDLVRRGVAGFTFRGRIGRDVKVSGVRVNLAHLERLVSDALGYSVCVLQHHGELVVLAEAQRPVSAAELALIGGVLRGPLIPRHVLAVPRLPRTRTGKLSVDECAAVARPMLDAS